MADISAAGEHFYLPPTHSFPTNSRHSLQWIASPPPGIGRLYSNNLDAAFLDQNLPKPADILLHYNYGVAVVKWWGKNYACLQERLDLPRPGCAIAALMPTTTTTNDRIGPNQKQEAASGKKYGQNTGKCGQSTHSAAAADAPEVQEVWDEDDVILFLWGTPRRLRSVSPARNRTAGRSWKNGEILSQKAHLFLIPVCLLNHSGGTFFEGS